MLGGSDHSAAPAGAVAAAADSCGAGVSTFTKQRRRLCCSSGKSCYWVWTFSLVSSMGPVSACFTPILKQPCMTLLMMTALTPFF